ncbi:ubiquinone biosynthesis accessory factor UbiJ [Candidatus Vondammii sp. HM_W22]|uniref:ubiquinone biosynthesis accessory factor UbiJ n=1 Tax=Candidatus Vondammii sp. HM_W22 TaxID=2687299 RepID=UPI001F149363|nr:SCP2 sterol-binding domain-containing protein [Candidatus Vondammii sp. HM_W22]
MSISAIAIAGLEEAFNRYIALDQAAAEQLLQLHGQVIAFDVVGLGLALYLIPGPGGLQILSEYEGTPDCRLRGTPIALAHMGNLQANSEQLFSGTVEISGDTELAHQFGKIIGGMEGDWEELLSHYTGDIVAHEVGKLFRSTGHWGRRSMDTLGLDVQEYLHEELRLLPVKLEIEAFMNDVDTLRDDGERLQARTDRLKRMAHENKQGESK